MSSSVLFPLLVVTFIYTINVQSSVNQTLCFPAEALIDETVVWSTFTSIITTTIQQAIGSEIPLCTSTTLSDINNDLHDCFLCNFDIITETATDSEELRYTTLSLINNNMDSIIQSIGEQITQLAYITYASADHADVNPRCTSMVYPRICRFDLAAVSKSGPVNFGEDGDTYYFSLAMDTTTKTLHYEISYNTAALGANNWFGVGFGPEGMSGDAAIYTCGELMCASPSVKDYYLEIIAGIRTAEGVREDIFRGGTDDFTDYSTSSVDGEFSVLFNRAFDTNDEWDLIFDGTETSLYVFAAIGADSLRLSAHAPLNVVVPIDIPFVPSPHDTDIEWCENDVVGDCIIAVEPIILTTNTVDTSVFPTENPTGNPSKNPTKNPTETPSISPSKDPTQTPTVNPIKAQVVPATTSSNIVDEMQTTDNANTYGLVMVFMVVIVTLCLN